MAATRLDSDERRQRIVDAAIPLFARKGFGGTTTRELAEAAGISEALLFRHCPSKELLYREILQQVGCQGDPVLEQLATLPATTATLVGMVRFMVRRFVAGSDADRADLDPRLRLILHSCLENGDYARELFDAVFARVVPFFNASLDAAVQAGDILLPPTSRESGEDRRSNQFWFGHHVATMIAIAALLGRHRTVRWFVIIGLALLVVLGALYGFNRYRSQAIATFFANNKPPPAQIAAVTAGTQSVPRFAAAIGSLAAVHQVTITPEVGGKVTAIYFTPGATGKAGDPLVQLNDAPERGDLANYEAQSRMAALSLERNSQLANKQFASRETVDQNQSQLDQARAQILKTQALIGQKLIRAPFAGRLGIRQIEVGQYVSPGAAVVTLTDLKELYVNFTLASTWKGQIELGQKVNVTADAFPGRSFTATITTIEPQIRSDTRTLTAQATLANPDEALLPGMFVNSAVVLPAEPDKVVLPETAVDYTLYGDSVYVVRQ